MIFILFLKPIFEDGVFWTCVQLGECLTMLGLSVTTLWNNEVGATMQKGNLNSPQISKLDGKSWLY